jgi:hypothetical protein
MQRELHPGRLHRSWMARSQATAPAAHDDPEIKNLIHAASDSWRSMRSRHG